MTSPIALERAVAPEESLIVRPGIILNKKALEEAVGPKDKKFKAGWLPYAKFLGNTYCCIAEQVEGVKDAYRVISHCLVRSQPETCPVVMASY